MIYQVKVGLQDIVVSIMNEWNILSKNIWNIQELYEYHFTTKPIMEKTESKALKDGKICIQIVVNVLALLLSSFPLIYLYISKWFGKMWFHIN